LLCQDVTHFCHILVSSQFLTGPADPQRMKNGCLSWILRQFSIAFFLISSPPPPADPQRMKHPSRVGQPGLAGYRANLSRSKAASDLSLI
jgi:hypothetical protein